MHIRKYRYIYILLLIFYSAGFAQEMQVPANVQADLIPKVLLLNKRFNGAVKITLGIVFSKSSRISYETMTALKSKYQETNNELEIHTIPIELGELNNLGIIADVNNIDVIYITPTRGVDHQNLKIKCIEKKILSISAVPDLVDNYYSVGFELIDNKVKIEINTLQAKEEGAEFSSRLLKIARLVNSK